jgi:anti-sigma regulatory factor (Ser/Thr protein kinase)
VYIPFYLNGSLLVSWYTVIRRVKLANAVTLAQDLIFPVLCAALFAMIGGNMLWLQLPAAGFATALLLPLLVAVTRRHDKETSFLLLLDTKPGGTALAFSVERDAEKASEASMAVGDFCEEQGMERRQTMLLSLAIEELISLIAEQNKSGGDVSVRLTRFEESTVLRLRDAGRRFNPIDYYMERLNTSEDIEDSVDLMGIKYITEAAEVVYYKETFGVNNLVVII